MWKGPKLIFFLKVSMHWCLTAQILISAGHKMRSTFRFCFRGVEIYDLLAFLSDALSDVTLTFTFIITGDQYAFTLVDSHIKRG